MGKNRKLYGPPVPSSSESWISEEVYNHNVLQTSEKKQTHNKEKNSLSKEEDYSSPGLHIRKNSQKRLFMDAPCRNKSSDKETDHRLNLMKKRFKRDKLNQDKVFDDASQQKSSHFREPNYCKSNPDDNPLDEGKRIIVENPCGNPALSSKADHKQTCNEQISDEAHQAKGSTNSNNSSSIIDDNPNLSSNNRASDTNFNDRKSLDDELNKLSASLIKAEIMGNSKKVIKLKKKIDTLKKQLQNQLSNPSTIEETVILTSSDIKGNVRPVSINDVTSKKKDKYRKNVTTHDSSGTRLGYFADDNEKEISKLVDEEKSIQKLGHDEIIMKYAGKLSKMASNRQNWTIDDMFESGVARQNFSSDAGSSRVLAQNTKHHKQLESCKMCLDKCHQALIIHVGKYLYVRVPPHSSLTKYHCQIVPITHIIATVNSDEEFQEELKEIKATLVNEFDDKGLDIVFLESAQKLYSRRHTFLDCIPLPKNDGLILPAFFKKSILDCDLEWAQNKKLIDTSHKSLYKSVPKGLPYFCVEFGMNGGFAHVIEEERLFKPYFGLEIIGNVLDCEINLWRAPEKETLEGIKYKKRMFEKLKMFAKYKSVNFTE